MEYAIKTLLSLVLTLTLPVFADCPKPVQIMKEGDKANCSGFLFSKEAETQAETLRDDNDFYRKLSIDQGMKSDLLLNENEVLQKRLTLYIQESKDLSQEKTKSETTETFIRLGYFSLGVFITALVARNVRR